MHLVTAPARVRCQLGYWSGLPKNLGGELPTKVEWFKLFERYRSSPVEGCVFWVQNSHGLVGIQIFRGVNSLTPTDTRALCTKQPQNSLVGVFSDIFTVSYSLWTGVVKASVQPVFWCIQLTSSMSSMDVFRTQFYEGTLENARRRRKRCALEKKATKEMVLAAERLLKYHLKQCVWVLQAARERARTKTSLFQIGDPTLRCCKRHCFTSGIPRHILQSLR